MSWVENWNELTLNSDHPWRIQFHSMTRYEGRAANAMPKFSTFLVAIRKYLRRTTLRKGLLCVALWSWTPIPLGRGAGSDCLLCCQQKPGHIAPSWEAEEEYAAPFLFDTGPSPWVVLTYVASGYSFSLLDSSGNFPLMCPEFCHFFLPDILGEFCKSYHK